MKRIVSKFVLKNRIDKYVKKLPIDERFKPIISDILLRRTAQFNRTYGELRSDLEALACNLERIRIVDRSRMSVHNYALAVYCVEDKEIIISEDTFKESPERIYQILAHELFHVMLKNNQGIDRFDKFNFILDTRSNLFQELIAEKGSYRLTYPVKNDYRGYNSNVSAYEDVAFVFDFIEAAYGISEQDIIKHSLNGRYEFARYLAGVAQEEVHDAEEFLDEIEVGGTLILSTLYDNENTRDRRFKSKNEIDENILAAIDSLFSVCQSKIEDRLRNTNIESIEEAIALREEIAFSEYRLINILQDRLKYFREELDIDVDKLWEKCLGDYAEDVILRICDIDQLLEDRQLRKSILGLDFINSVRGYSFDDEEFYKKFLEQRKPDRAYRASKEIIASKREPAIYTEGWKNKRIIKMIGAIIESERKNKSRARIINPRLAFEAQPGDKSGIEVYRLNDEERAAYEEKLRAAKTGHSSDVESEYNIDINIDEDK